MPIIYSKIRHLAEANVVVENICAQIEQNPAELLNAAQDEYSPLFTMRFYPSFVQQLILKHLVYFKDGTTALMAAALMGDLATVIDLIIKAPETILDCDHRGRTALYWAAAAGRFSIVSHFLLSPHCLKLPGMKDQLISGVIEHFSGYTLSENNQTVKENCLEIIAYSSLLEHLTTKDKENLVTSLMRLGNFYLQEGQFEKSIHMLMQAKDICEKESKDSFLKITLDKIQKTIERNQKNIAKRSMFTSTASTDELKIDLADDARPHSFNIFKLFHTLLSTGAFEEGKETRFQQILMLARHVSYFIKINCYEQEFIPPILPDTHEFLSLLSLMKPSNFSEYTGSLALLTDVIGFCQKLDILQLGKITTYSLLWEKSRLILNEANECLSFMHDVCNEETIGKMKEVKSLMRDKLLEEEKIRLDQLSSILSQASLLLSSINPERFNHLNIQTAKGFLNDNLKIIKAFQNTHPIIKDVYHLLNKCKDLMQYITHMHVLNSKYQELHHTTLVVQQISTSHQTIPNIEEIPFNVEQQNTILSINEMLFSGDQQLQQQQFTEALSLYQAAQCCYLAFCEENSPADLPIDVRSLRSIIEQKIAFTSENQQLGEEVSAWGFRAQDVPGDGNCLFHAVELHTHINHAELRQRTADHIFKHKDYYINFIDFTSDREAAFDSYLEQLRADQVSADHLAVAALSNLLEQTIVIFQSNGQRPIITKPANTTEAIIYLARMSLTSKHYQFCYPQPDLSTKPPLQSIQELIAQASETDFHTHAPLPVSASAGAASPKAAPKSPLSIPHSSSFFAPPSTDDLEASYFDDDEDISYYLDLPQ